MKHIVFLFPLVCGCATITGLPKLVDANEDGRYSKRELAAGVVDLVFQTDNQKEELIEVREAIKSKQEQIDVFTEFIKDITSSQNECVRSLAQHARECILAPPE